MRKFYKIVLHGPGRNQVRRVPCVDVRDPEQCLDPINVGMRVSAFAARGERGVRLGGVIGTRPRATPTA